MPITWNKPNTGGIKWEQPSVPIPPATSPLDGFSILDSLKNVGIGVAKGVGSTIQGAGVLGTKILNTATGQNIGSNVFKPETPIGQDITKALTPEGTAQKVGFGAEKIAEFAIPGTKVSKATAPLSFFPKVALRTAGDVGISALQTGGDIEEAKKTGEISAGVQTAIPVLGYGMKILGSLFKGTAGLATGAGTDLIDQILKTPKASLKGMKSEPIQTLTKDVQAVRNNIFDLKKASTANYSQALENLPGGFQAVKTVTGKLMNPAELGQVAPGIQEPSKTFFADVGGKQIPLTMNGVKNTLTSLLKKYGAKIKNGQPDFFETTLKNSEQSVLSQAWDDVYKWSDTSPVGLDKLAAKINAYIKPGDTSPQLNGILSDLSQGTRRYLASRIPEAKPMVDRYIAEQNFIDTLQTHLGKVANPTSPAGIKSTMGKINTLFTKNKEMARQVLESLPGGSEILGQQAGRELQTQVSRSTGKIGDILSGIVQAVIPPKIIGEIVAYTGMAAEKIQPIVDILQKLQPTERAVILQTFLENPQQQ